LPATTGCCASFFARSTTPSCGLRLEAAWGRRVVSSPSLHTPLPVATALWKDRRETGDLDGISDVDQSKDHCAMPLPGFPNKRQTIPEKLYQLLWDGTMGVQNL